MDYYFLYKPINLSNLGGVFPKTDDNIMTLGICEKDGYYLGKTIDPTSINVIVDYFVGFITETEAIGFKLLGLTQIEERDESDPMNFTIRDLTSDELTAQKAAERIMVKYKLRNHLAVKFSDIPDMLADANKKYELLERIFMEIGIYLIQGEAVPSTVQSKYLPLFQSYADKLSNDDITIRADIEPNILTFYEDLLSKTNEMNNMVNSLYLSVVNS